MKDTNKFLNQLAKLSQSLHKESSEASKGGRIEDVKKSLNEFMEYVSKNKIDLNENQLLSHFDSVTWPESTFVDIHIPIYLQNGDPKDIMSFVTAMKASKKID